MAYDRLDRDRFAGEDPSFSTLPDGSIDHYGTVSIRGDGRIESRSALGREIATGTRSTFRFSIDSTEPGGQSVNVADQLAAVGGDVTCYGHLDDAVFDAVPFATASMGRPAAVYAFNFAESDVMFVDESTIEAWSLDDLLAVADLDTVFGVDAVCCANWVSVPGLGDAFRRLGGRDLPRVPFILDPGDVTGVPASELAGLLDALAALQGRVDVILNANRGEIRATAAALPNAPGTDRDRLAAIREAAGLEAVVMHAREEAAVATEDGVTTVPNIGVRRSHRHTGAGDRFTGGLAYGVAAGWDWAISLALANACAGHFIETGSSGSPADVLGFVEDAA